MAKTRQYLSMKVLKRFLKDSELAHLNESYTLNLRRTHVLREPSESDKKIDKKLHEVHSITEVAKYFKISRNQVLGAIARVSGYRK